VYFKESTAAKREELLYIAMKACIQALAELHTCNTLGNPEPCDNVTRLLGLVVGTSWGLSVYSSSNVLFDKNVLDVV
jgi:hypothetical protein